MKDLLDLLARAFISAIFLFEAFTSAKFFERTKLTMTEYGITWNQEFLLICTIIALSIGGIFLLIGYRPGFAVLLLLIYWIPVTFIVYSFWNKIPEKQTLYSILFMKNIAITGGLIHIYLYGTGRYSFRRLVGMTRIPKS
ncbi:MAG: DoxX family protein [Saprospiraceae bacterium]|nr:DoxX family protein [Saprospiraceae bacterium]MBK7812182.1 DoxX family protein [Saprospiraceae bacterium]MBK9632600.1 DoxX family protein [Saprospiraceae bacterium]